MTTVTYPSPIVPGPPPLVLDVPEDWEQVWAPDTLIAVRQQEPREHFLANVVIRYFHRAGDFDEETAVQELRDFLETKTDGTVGDRLNVTIGERTWSGASVSYREEDAGTIGQMHLFTASPRGEILDVLQMTGSVAGDRVDEDMPVIEQVFQSLRVNA